MRRAAAIAGAAAVLLAGGGCKLKQLNNGTGGGVTVGPDSGGEAAQNLAERGLAVTPCRGSDGVLSLSGIWIFAFESVSQVSGSVPGTQTEVVTRYGIAQLCQDALDVRGEMLLCEMTQGRLEDESGDCAAQVPTVGVLATLPVAKVRGGLAADDPEGSALTLRGWREDWGLSAEADVPAEPSGTDALDDADGVVDADEDDAPGVTLHGDGEVPTVAWAVRRTAADFALTAGDRTLSGLSAATTVETILGGPAARALRGRVRTPAQGQATFVRADGRFGSSRLDADGDGTARCAELGAVMSTLLPAPRADGCGE